MNNQIIDLQEKQALGLLSEAEQQILLELEFQAGKQRQSKGYEKQLSEMIQASERRFLRVEAQALFVKTMSKQSVYNALVSSGLVKLNENGKTDYNSFVTFIHPKNEKRTSSNVIAVIIDTQAKN